MTRPVLVRLVIAAGGLATVAVAALVVLVLTTSAPELPPPPLPTATHGPGPASMLRTHPLPTATHGPGPASTPALGPRPLPAATHGPGAGPNTQLRALIAAGLDTVAAQDNLIYGDAAHPGEIDPPCDDRGHWTLDVNPQDVVGHPYLRPPSVQDWARAAGIIAIATSICPASIRLQWVGHYAGYTGSDRWTALLPSSLAATITPPTLWRYALRHARQLQ